MKRNTSTMKRTGRVVKIEITAELISEYAPCDPWNNPIVDCLKREIFPDATQIMIHDDDVWVEGVPIYPGQGTTKWIIDWMRGRKVKPCILAFEV